MFFSPHNPSEYSPRVGDAFEVAAMLLTTAHQAFTAIKGRTPWKFAAPFIKDLHHNLETEDEEEILLGVHHEFAVHGFAVKVGPVCETSAHATALALAQWVRREIWQAATEPKHWLDKFDVAVVKRNYAAVLNHFVALPVFDVQELEAMLRKENIVCGTKMAEAEANWIEGQKALVRRAEIEARAPAPEATPAKGEHLGQVQSPTSDAGWIAHLTPEQTKWYAEQGIAVTTVLLPEHLRSIGSPVDQVQTPAPAGGRTRMKVEEANEKAMKLAHKMRAGFFALSERQQAELIGCSWQTWRNTAFYGEAKAERPAGKRNKPSSPKTESLTAGREAATGEGEKDEVLQGLIAEQEADREPSPLETDPPNRPRKIHHRKRL